MPVAPSRMSRVLLCSLTEDRFSASLSQDTLFCLLMEDRFSASSNHAPYPLQSPLFGPSSPFSFSSIFWPFSCAPLLSSRQFLPKQTQSRKEATSHKASSPFLCAVNSLADAEPVLWASNCRTPSTCKRPVSTTSSTTPVLKVTWRQSDRGTHHPPPSVSLLFECA
jgi:hypothetical protein